MYHAINKTALVYQQMSFYEVTKTLTDFGGELNGTQFTDQVRDNSSIATPCVGTFHTVNTNAVKIIFTAALSAAESTALDTLISNYVYAAPGLLNEVVISENPGQRRTEGYFDVKSYKVACGPNQISSVDIMFKYGIEVQGIHLFTKGTEDNDTVSVQVFPFIPNATPYQSTFGVLTADANIGDTVLNVSSPILSLFRVGFFMFLKTMDNDDDVGRAFKVDLVNNQITLENPLTKAYTAGDALTMAISMMDRKHVPPMDRESLYGSFNNRSSYISAYSIIRACYHNVHLSNSKLFIADVEYRYADPS